MKGIIWISIIVGVVIIGVGYFVLSKKQEVLLTKPILAPTNIPVVAEKETLKTHMPLTITSPSFQMNGTIPSLFTCDGKNISPELNFSNIPEGTQSLALTMEDPDVPKTVRADGMWNHWIIWNIPPQATRLEEGKVPLLPSVVGTNTSGKRAYVGPCPPDREHRYIFTLYALNTTLSLSESSTKENLLKALTPHIIEKATLVGRYNP